MTTRLPDPAFWLGKRVFVTGHSGFKGAWLSLLLERLGAETSGFSLQPNSQPSLCELIRINESQVHDWVDIRDSSVLMDRIASFRPDIILHLAAQPLVRRSHREPLETFTTNVNGTLHVLEVARACASTQAVIVVTTDKVYRNSEQGHAFVENDALGGLDPYSASKAAAEMVVNSYRHSFFAPEGKALAAARAGNVIGGGDWSEDRILPDAVRAWGNGGSLEVRNPEATRPWQHVLEPLCGYLCLAETIFQNPSAATDFNFGPEPQDIATVRDVVEIAREAFGRGEVAWGVRRDSLHEAKTLSLDNSKAKKALGVTSIWNLRTAVERTMRWYRRQLEGEDARALCDEDIDAFFSAS
ncbi:MAG: CDP-glucose 4,6-dehydratase [Verrucomicrobia bacterium]|nr:CDP-glucose 4,6-dehydratase [Verrucomicrobiota bacterium]